MMHPATRSRGVHRVTLIEDNEGDIELVKDALDQFDVEVDVIQEPTHAVRILLERQRPDLILLDLKMPRKSGLEVLRAIQDRPELNPIPVVVLTSSEAPSDLQQAYALNARACFAKPHTGFRSLIERIISFADAMLPVPEESAGAVARPEPPLIQHTGVGEDRKEFLSALVDSASEAMVGLTLDGEVRSWNHAATDLFGIGKKDAIGKTLSSLIKPHDTELTTLIERITRTNQGARVRTRFGREEGQAMVVELTFSPVRSGSGHILGISAVVRDITDHHLAEERFRLAVEASPSAMLMVDESGRIALINAETERLFGYSRQELIGRTVDALVPRRYREQHPKHRVAFMNSPESRAMGAGRELFGLRKDGTEVPIEIGLNPIETRDGTYVLSSIVDITERRQAEERFRLAVEASPHGIVMVNSDGGVLLMNAEAERMFGYSRAEMVGQPIEKLLPRRLRDAHVGYRSDFIRHPSTRAMGIGRDLYAVRKDGSEFPVEVGLNPIFTNGERLILSTIVDITEQRRAKDELARQTAELARSNQELEQFAYVASHDLQEPLRMVSSYTELLGERYHDVLDEKGSRYIRYAQNGAQRMAGLIKDLLAYSRVRTQGRELATVQLRDCFDNALRQLKVAIQDSQATVEVGEGMDAKVLGDERQLTQVFQNLLSNALKFSAEEPPHVRTHAEVGDEVTVYVEDNGIGIEPEHNKRVFQMFDRLHTREEYPGSGIGLALSKRIIERHGGEIRVESDGKSGSVFSFTLRIPE